VATGGLAGAVLEACETVQRHEPWLTLHGLRIVWDRNNAGGLKERSGSPPEAGGSGGLKERSGSPPEDRGGGHG
jgi:hypothetical protein